MLPDKAICGLVVICLALWVGAEPSLPAGDEAPAPGNLLRNPGFEDGMSSWATEGNNWYEQPAGSGLSGWAVDEAQPHSGGRCLRLDGSGNRGVAHQGVPAVPGAEYRASGWVRSEGLGEVEAGFDIGFIGAGSAWLGGQAPPALTGDRDWTLLTCTFSAPEGTQSLRMHIFTRAANSGRVWFDDMRIERVVPPAPVLGLKLAAQADGSVSLDWSGYAPAGSVRKFRAYRSEHPFDSITQAERIAEIGAETSRHVVAGGGEAFFAVTGVDGQGREDKRVSSTSVVAQREPRNSAPNCLWAESFEGEPGCLESDGIEFRGGARLAAPVVRHWYRPGGEEVTREGGWPEEGLCTTAGASLTVRFAGTSLLAYGPARPDLGILEVSVDGGAPRDVDLYAPDNPAQQVVLATGLADTDHTAMLRLSGRRSEKATGADAQIDLLESTSARRASDGWLLSEPIACPPGVEQPWGKLRYGAAAPPGTSIGVDVLGRAGEMLLPDVVDGCDLSALRTPIIQLRARLRSSDPAASPLLAFWQVEYTAQPSGGARGVVLDALSGRGIKGSEISLRSAATDAAQPIEVKAGPDGTVGLAGIAAGAYDVTASAPGYLSASPRRLSVGDSAVVTMALYPEASLLGNRLAAWAVANTVSVFRDSLPPEQTSARLSLEAAANEYEPAQLALRAREPLGSVVVSTGELTNAAAGYSIPAQHVRAYMVGYVPVPLNSPYMEPEELGRPAPGYFPDPLLPVLKGELQAGVTQPVWVTVHVPADAPPGRYEGALRLRTAYGDAEVPIELTVWPFALKDASQTWFGHGCSGWGQVIDHYAVTGTEQERWQIIDMALRDRAAHRENVIYIDASVFGLCRITVGADGGYRYDFSELDRWIEAVRKAYPHGQYLIETGCFAGRDGWTASEIFMHGCTVYDEQGRQDRAHSLGRISTDAPEFSTLARPFFSALEKHLDELGMLDRVYTRLQDEPLETCLPAYRRLAQLVHDAAPRLRRFEAIQTKGLEDCLEIQDAQLDWFDKNRDYYLSTRRPGCQVWFYTCWMPRGRYPSRLIDYPLIKHRIIQWMVHSMGADGYDRFGWAMWTGDPYEAFNFLAPGDSFVVYPDPAREQIVGSLRWEIMRESMEDYEYLATLTERAALAAKELGANEGEFDAGRRALELSSQAAPSCTDYLRDPEALMALRRQVAEEICATGARPRVVLQTDPPAVGTVRPQAVKVRGITEPGATVDIRGAPVPVGADGRFEAAVDVSAEQPQIEVRVSKGGETLHVTRVFRVVGEEGR